MPGAHAALPDDGVGDRLARGSFPEHGGLALVGDADGRDVGRRGRRLREGLLRHGDLGGPDRLGVVLDERRSREDLRELLLCLRDHASVASEEDGAAGGGALIEGEDVFHRESGVGSRDEVGPVGPARRAGLRDGSRWANWPYPLRAFTLHALDRIADAVGVGRVAVADAEVVGRAAEDGADARGHDGHPPVAVGRREHPAAPARERREQARPEVARRVDRIARVDAEGHADGHHRQADEHRCERGGRWGVALVAEREHHRHQQGGADDLVDEATERREVRGRVRGEDARGALRAHDLPHAPVEGGERLAIRQVDQGGAGKGAEHLRGHVRQDACPREAAAHGEGQGHGRVEMGAADAGRRVDAEDHGQAPAQVDAERAPGAVVAEDRLRDHPETEGDEDGRAEEFREGFTHRGRYPEWLTDLRSARCSA